MIKAVIFDLDGTLSYTLDSISVSGNKTMEAMGLPIYEIDRYKYFCGDGADELVRRMLINNGDINCERFDQARKLYAEYFAKYAKFNVRPYGGMVDTLNTLQEKGIRLAVLSNKPHPQTITVVEELFGKGVFDYIQGNTKEIKRKPSSDGAFIIADKLGIATNDILYVGDTATDMQTGNGANMHTVGALWGYRTREELEANNAEYIIENPLDILRIVESI